MDSGRVRRERIVNTDTGRIYGPDVMEAARVAGPPVNFDGFVSHGGVYSDAAAELTREQEVMEARVALARGEAVPVSERVVQQQTLGQRELRRRKRRAQRDARRRNR